MDNLILVTGSTGFIASEIIAQLLEQGGTVRSKDPEKVKHITELEGASENLELVVADLLDKESLTNACKDVSIVLHTASPFQPTVQDPQKDLVDPALLGTLSVLEACKEHNVKKVILTSSVASITDSPKKDYVYTEKDWNEESSLDRNPYYYSKKVAEEAAWNFVKENNDSFDLVVINPFLVIGPAKNLALNPSSMLEGEFPGILDLGFGYVDVSDVAKAHILAMKPEASGRYITWSETLSMREVCEILNEEFPGYKTPTKSFECKTATKIVKMAARFQDSGTRDYLRTNLGTFPLLDHSKMEGLGLEFRPARDSIIDTVRDLIQKGHVKTVPKGSKKNH